MLSMIERECPCCQELFTPNRYHPDQEYCLKPACRKASHAAANRRWRRKQSLHDPLRESERKRRARRREKFRIALEMSRWRKQGVFQQMLLLGMVGLLSGANSQELAMTLSRCLDAGREFLRSGVPQELVESFGPGFGFS